MSSEKMIWFICRLRAANWEETMNQVLKILWKILKILFVVVSVLFVVYFWNLDQKLMGWVYTQVHHIHDRKSVDIKF